MPRGMGARGIPGPKQDVSDFLIARAQLPWLQDLLVACEELSGEDLLLHRSCGAVDSVLVHIPDEVFENPYGMGAASGMDADDTEAPEPADAIAQLPADELAELHAAVTWAIGIKDEAVVSGLLQTLPMSVLQEQRALYEKREIATKKPAVAGGVLNPKNYQSKKRFLLALDAYLTQRGLAKEERLPKNTIVHFMRENGWTVMDKYAGKENKPNISRWYKQWKARWGT